MSINCLAVLLFHNDEDLVADQIKYYKYDNKHDLIVFNHNSSDNTSNELQKYKDDILCIYDMSSKISFKDEEVHDTIYKIIQGNQDINKSEIKLSNSNGYNLDIIKNYEWISFPESDEFLEGPDRKKSYYNYLCDINNTKINYIYFRTYTYWFTEKDNINENSPVQRIKYYCINNPGDTSLDDEPSKNGNSASKLYTWRACANINTHFGHALCKVPNEMQIWNTRHYEIRSKDHLIKKLKDRCESGITHHHTVIMNQKLSNGEFYNLQSCELYYDDGINDLNTNEKFNWNKVYEYE